MIVDCATELSLPFCREQKPRALGHSLCQSLVLCQKPSVELLRKLKLQLQNRRLHIRMTKPTLSWHLRQIGRSVFNSVRQLPMTSLVCLMSMHVAMSYHVGSVVQCCMLAAERSCLFDQWTCVCMCAASQTHSHGRFLMLPAVTSSKAQHCLGTTVQDVLGHAVGGCS